MTQRLMVVPGTTITADAMTVAADYIVVIGGSAGALDPLREILAQLSPELAAALFVVIHSSAESAALLTGILGRAGRLPTRVAADESPIKQGVVFVAPPERHLVVKLGRMRITRGPRETSGVPPLMCCSGQPRWHADRVRSVSS
jgi:chemotaxis response regulator CheB